MTIRCLIFGCKWKRRGSWPDELVCRRCLAVKDRSELSARERRKEMRNSQVPKSSPSGEKD